MFAAKGSQEQRFLSEIQRMLREVHRSSVSDLLFYSSTHLMSIIF
jgi:hypothetical protein